MIGIGLFIFGFLFGLSFIKLAYHSGHAQGAREAFREAREYNTPTFNSADELVSYLLKQEGRLH